MPARRSCRAGTFTIRLRDYVPTLDEPLRRGDRYLTPDGLGSTTTLTDASGTAVQQYRYSPFGEQQQAITENNPFQFTGRENDATGLMYYRARYYKPAWGRFLNEDPIGFAGGINPYVYADNDPINHVDPSGLQGYVIAERAFQTFGEPLIARAGPALSAAAASAQQWGASALQGAITHGQMLQRAAEQWAGPAWDALQRRIEDLFRLSSKESQAKKRGCGPSGKPKVHSVDHATKKRAQEAAETDSPIGKAVKHSNPKNGDRPHFHPADQSGNKLPDGAHHYYPD